MDETQIEYKSEFLPDITIVVVFKEDPLYPQVNEYFDEYGYGFMVPGKNLIIVDGEQVDIFDDLKFIEAHEVSHIIMGHDGSRNQDDEVDADLGAYILLKQSGKNESLKQLLKYFKTRHGIKFDENLLERVKNYFS